MRKHGGGYRFVIPPFVQSDESAVVVKSVQ
jgi:hypothetical protein